MLAEKLRTGKERYKNLWAYVMLLRPHHWAKNLFLFLPLFFSGQIFDLDKLAATFYGFIAFGFIASSIYIINDYMDVESDRKHPVKSKRPIASGLIPKPAALALFFLCLAIGVSIALVLKVKFLFLLMLYFSINIGYSLGLKNISILDIVLLASGFVIRVKAGGVLTTVATSEWLIIMIFLLAVFLTISKRRDDALLKLESGADMRKSISGYNLNFLNVALGVITSIIIIAYLMYSISPEVMSRWNTHRLYYTALFVIMGLLRYLQIALVENNSGSPTKLLYRDKFLQVTILLWVLSFYVIIYMPDVSIFK